MHNFVLDQTRLTTLAFLPSISLRLAEELVPIWERSQREEPPFWAFAWAGGQALAHYLLDHPHLVQGRTVLDLASGCGVVAIAAAQCGATSVVASEIDGYSIEAIKINSNLNRVQATVHPQFGDLLDTTSEVDVILAGDVFYSREMSRRVLSFVERSGAALVLVGDPSRAYTPATGWERIAEYDVPVTRELEDSETKRTAILRGLQGQFPNIGIAFT